MKFNGVIMQLKENFSIRTKAYKLRINFSLSGTSVFYILLRSKGLQDPESFLI